MLFRSGSLGSALFVGIMSADADRLMAAGASKAQAYAAGFSHTLFIDIGILAVAFIVSIVFARVMRKQRQQRSADAQTMTPPATTSSPQ